MVIKKYSKVFLSLFLLAIIFSILFYNFDGKLGKGNYFLYDAGYQAIKCRNKNNIYIIIFNKLNIMIILKCLPTIAKMI
jgi:hypothetical protein